MKGLPCGASLVALLTVVPHGAAHSFSLSPHVEYPVGSMPLGLAAADLDGDGDVDIVVGNVLSQDLSLLLNHGDGTFADDVRVAVGAQPRSLAIGDVDQDGYPDLVIGVQSGPSVLAVLLNDGTGSFASPELHGPQPEVPDTVVLGLFDTDLDLDVAVVQGNAGEVLVFRGRSGPDFHNAVTYLIPSNALNGGLAAADLDGDADLDLTASFIYSFGTPAVLWNQGNGSFTLGEPFNLTNTNTPAIQAALIDDQPGADIVQIANAGVQLFPNDGSGSFGPMLTFDPGVLTTSVTRMVLADLDGSGKPDVLITGSGSNEVGILLNDGTGNLDTASQHATGPFNGDVAAADLNADGFPEVIASNRDGHSVSVLLNATGATDAPLPQPAASLRLGAARPNPTRSGTTITYSTAHPASVTIAIYDVAGRLVVEWSRGTVPAGEHTFTWDGRAADGRAVPAGVYSIRVEAAGVSAAERFVRLR